jgi:hypothetical protein
MALHSVLKIRVKTSKLFALRASPYKGSKPRVKLKQFIFSTIEHRALKTEKNSGEFLGGDFGLMLVVCTVPTGF